MKRVSKRATPVPVPQTHTEANATLARIGELQRRLAQVQTGLDAAIADAKAAAEADAVPLKAEVETLTTGLQVWAEANRTAITENGRTKTAKLPAGEIGWRTRPHSVRVTGVEDVLKRLVEAGLDRFVRVKREVNKEAMLAEPAIAATVDGVAIGSPGEDFFVAPAAMPLAPAAAP